MRAMVLEAQGRALRAADMAVPRPGPEQVLVRVRACGVCRTDLHVMDGDLKDPKLPLVLGHEIAGTVESLGDDVRGFEIGERIGVPWLGYTDGVCRYCREGCENLCDHPRFTGYTIDGGYAEYTVADHRYCFPLPSSYADVDVAPLLCAGLIGYRSYRLAGGGESGGGKLGGGESGGRLERLGIYGFGAAGHIIAQVARHEGKRVFAFTRPGDHATQEFARKLGAVWAGDSGERPPEELDAAIVLAPVGALMVEALRVTAKGGIVVSGGIHMSDIPSFPYRLLWEEREIRSVANLTRHDGEEFLRIAPQVPVKAEVEVFALEEANEALDRLRSGRLRGAAVLDIAGGDPDRDAGEAPETGAGRKD